MEGMKEMISGEAIPKFENEPFKWIWAIDFIEPGDQEEIRLAVERIKILVANPENYLGKGGAGKVYDMGNDLCLKLVKNRHNNPNIHH